MINDENLDKDILRFCVIGSDLVKNWGIGLIVWGCVGLFLGHVMFGDIGITCSYAAITSIIVGVAFIK